MVILTLRGGGGGDSCLQSDFYEGRVTKILNFALKMKVGSRDGGTYEVLPPCHLPKIWNVHQEGRVCLLQGKCESLWLLCSLNDSDNMCMSCRRWINLDGFYGLCVMLGCCWGGGGGGGCLVVGAAVLGCKFCSFSGSCWGTCAYWVWDLRNLVPRISEVYPGTGSRFCGSI